MRLIRDGEKAGTEGGRGDYIPIAALSPPDDSCIKIRSDESHFNVSLIVRDKVTSNKPPHF